MDAPRAAWIRRALAIAALLAGAACAPAQAFHLTDVQGKAHSLETHRGKWVVLNVWATWCAPCIKEMPELDALARARSDIVVLGLAADGDNRSRIEQFAGALHVSYPIIAGDERLMKEMKVRAYPTTLLYDAQGRLVHTSLGQLTRGQLEQQLPPLADK